MKFTPRTSKLNDQDDGSGTTDHTLLTKESRWKPEQHPLAALVATEEDSTTTVTAGGIPTGTTFPAETPLDTIMNQLLFPTQNPTLTNPKVTLTTNVAALQEIGDAIDIILTATFNRGSISPAYGTSGYRSGLPEEYSYYPIMVFSYSNLLVNSTTILGFPIPNTTVTWQVNVSYLEGEQPKNSKGEDYLTPLPTSFVLGSVSILGVYPIYATINNISVLDKLPLVNPANSPLEVTLVAESDTESQIVEFPHSWPAITGIEVFSTTSNSWEWIGGTRANSVATFGTIPSSHVLHGKLIDYVRYVDLGPKYGIRKLRFHWG
jgi:hypothetical protein